MTPGLREILLKIEAQMAAEAARPKGPRRKLEDRRLVAQPVDVDRRVMDRRLVPDRRRIPETPQLRQCVKCRLWIEWGHNNCPCCASVA